MPIISLYGRARVVVGTVVAATVIGTNAASAKPDTRSVTLGACVSDRGYRYSVLKNYGKVLDGKGAPTIYHNGSGHNSTLTLQQSASGTVHWSVNSSVTATAGFDFFAVSGGVSASVGGSYSRSTTTNHTVSASITVPNNKYGILQGGVFRQKTYGHYFMDNGNCTFSTGQYINTKIVYRSQGFASTVNTTGAVPWDQQ